MSLYCGRCEKPLDGHDAKACGRRMSRRYFFRLGAAAIALGMAPKLPWKSIARAGYGTILGIGDRLSVNFNTIRPAFATVEITMVDCATQEKSIIGALLGNPSLPEYDKVFFVAPANMKIVGTSWNLSIEGSEPFHPVMTVERERS